MLLDSGFARDWTNLFTEFVRVANDKVLIPWPVQHKMSQVVTCLVTLHQISTGDLIWSFVLHGKKALIYVILSDR